RRNAPPRFPRRHAHPPRTSRPTRLSALYRTVIEKRHGFPAALRTLGGFEERPGFPGALRTWGVEERPGCAGALRTLGGVGGHFGAPHFASRPRARGRLRSRAGRPGDRAA